MSENGVCPRMREAYDDNDHLPVTCPMCSATFCRACWTFWLVSNGGICISCSRVVDQEFLDRYKLCEYMRTGFLRYRRNVLFGRCISVTPMVMHHVIQEKFQRDKRNSTAAVERDLCKLAAQKLERELPRVRRRASLFRREISCRLQLAKSDASVRSQVEGYKSGFSELQQRINQMVEDKTDLWKRANFLWYVHRRDVTKTARLLERGRALVYVCWCKNPGCRGLVEKELMECVLCHTAHCRKCHVQSTDTQHMCSIDAIVKAEHVDRFTCEKCSSVILRMEGCAEVYCIKCHRAHAWDTGAVLQEGPSYTATSSKGHNFYALFMECVASLSLFPGDCRKLSAFAKSVRMPREVAQHPNAEKMLPIKIIVQYVIGDISRELLVDMLYENQAQILQKQVVQRIETIYCSVINHLIAIFAFPQPSACDKLRNFINAFQLIPSRIERVLTAVGLIYPDSVQGKSVHDFGVHKALDSAVFCDFMRILNCCQSTN